MHSNSASVAVERKSLSEPIDFNSLVAVESKRSPKGPVLLLEVTAELNIAQQRAPKPFQLLRTLEFS